MKYRFQLLAHSLDTALRRPWVIRSLAAATIATIFALIVAVIALSLGLSSVSQANHKSSVALVGLQAQALHTCEINNVIRAIQNASENADYPLFDFVKLRFSTPTKSTTAAQRQITEQFAGKLQKSLDAKIWVTLTDCAVSPNSQEIEAFQIAQRPAPKDATDLQNALKPDPDGSLP